MKELPIEEKAKAYDEAVRKAKEALDSLGDNYTCSHLTKDDIREMYANFFPELKESEDERIRKEMLEYCYKRMNNEFPSITIHQVKRWLTWLEKQGEQKPVIEMKSAEESLDIDSDTYNKIVDECIFGEQKSEEEVDNLHNYLYGEQKPDDKKGMNLVEEEMTPFQKKVFCIIDTTIEEEQGLKQVCDELLRLAHDEIMQKPAWSEEDEKSYYFIIEDYVERLDATPPDELAYRYSKAVDFLKSLRFQSHWKPTEAQIWILEYVTDRIPDKTYLGTMKGLINDLKKL